MSVINVTTLSPGLVGVYPRLIYINTTDTLATVITTGYLNAYAALNPGNLVDGDMALVVTRLTPNAINVDSGFLQVNVAAGNYSLIQTNSPGSVVLPTTLNHIATYTGTTGGLTEDPATAISGGNIQAGLSGTAGYLATFPATAAKGSLKLMAANNAGNTITTITNASFGQATVLTIPDPGVAAATFVLSDGGTQHITSGNFEVDQGNLIAGSSGHAGTLISYPATAANGTFIFAAVNAGGAFNTTISNSAMGQASVISIPDPGVATTNFILADNATTQTINTGSLILTAGNLSLTAGNLTAGSSGHAGTVTSYPGTAANGSLILAGVNAGGAFTTTISNGTMGQSTIYTIPDAGAGTGQFIVKTAAFVSGNFPQNSGTAGLVIDSGLAVSDIVSKTATNVFSGAGQITLAKANGTEAGNAVTASGNAGVITTSSLSTAGGSTYAITWTNTLITATSSLAFAVVGGTNTVQDISFTCVPGSGTATLTIYNNTAATVLNGTIFISYIVL